MSVRVEAGSCAAMGRMCNFRPSEFGGAFCLRCNRQVKRFCVNNGQIVPHGECDSQGEAA